MDKIKQEPAVVIGLVFSCIVAVLTTVAGSGLIDGKGLVLVNDLVTILPLVAGAITRFFVTPAQTSTVHVTVTGATNSTANVDALAASLAQHINSQTPPAQ